MSETIVYTHVKVPDCEWCDKAKELLLAASQESQAGRIPGFWGSEAERMLAPLLVQAEKEVVPDKGPIEDTKKDK